MVARLALRDFYKYLFLAIIALYAFGLTLFGFETWDTGYIPGYSWRIVNGQTVYADFVYKGPPLTLYLHAFFIKILPEFAQFYFLKSLTMLMFGLQVFLLVSGMDRLYNLRSIGINKWVLMSIGFVVSILNFPGYPWPTTDGLLFASLSFYLVVSKDALSAGRLILIAIICLMSALTKQSFYPIPLIFAFWILMGFGWKRFGIYLVALSVWIIAFILLLGKNFRNFLSQTTGETHIEDLLYVGFHNYKRAITEPDSLLFIIIGTVLLGIAKIDLRRSKLSELLRWLPVSIAAFAMFCAFYDILESSRILMAACGVAIVTGLAFKSRKISFYIPILVIIGIAWCSSISLGYQYPIFYFSGIFACFVVLCHEELAMMLTPKFYFLPSILLLVLGISAAWQPYRERPLPELTQTLGDISPKLAFIRSNPETYAKLYELKSLSRKYPEFVAAPSMPMAYYLFNAQNPLPSDWLINTEVDRKYDLFLTLASNEKFYVLLEKSFLRSEDKLPENQRSSIIGWKMYQNLQKVDETEHFIVLNGIK